VAVINVSWYDAQKYVSWISRKNGKTYRCCRKPSANT
jgi:formylglycine-generating enzyme required for sulfatase activity